MITTIENRNSGVRRVVILAASVLVLMVMLAMLKPVSVSAAEKASIKISTQSAVAGEEMQVTVIAAGDNLGRVEAMLKYDKSLMSYVSGGQSEGDNGTVQLKKSGTGNDIEFKLIFKAKKAGETDLKISGAHAYDMDDRAMKCSASEGSVTISESAGSEEGAQNGEATKQDDEASGNSGSEKASGKNADDEEIADENDQGNDPEVAEQPADDQAGQGEKDPETKGSNNGMMLFIVVAAVAVLVILVTVIIIMRMKKNKNDPDMW